MTNEICKPCGKTDDDIEHCIHYVNYHKFEPLENHTRKEQKDTTSNSVCENVPCETLADKGFTETMRVGNPTLYYEEDIKTALKRLKEKLSNKDYLFWLKVREVFGGDLID